MSEEDLIEIEARAAKATPGPWDATDDENDGEWSIFQPGAWTPLLRMSLAAGNSGDARFIAAARQDVPGLCAALREAWDRIALLEEYPLIELTVQMPIVDEPPHRNRFAQFYRRGGGQ